MNTELWATIGTILTTFALFIVPGLVYTWYALEHVIGDKKSYAKVIARSNGGTMHSEASLRDPAPATRRQYELVREAVGGLRSKETDSLDDVLLTDERVACHPGCHGCRLW